MYYCVLCKVEMGTGTKAFSFLGVLRDSQKRVKSSLHCISVFLLFCNAFVSYKCIIPFLGAGWHYDGIA